MTSNLEKIGKKIYTPPEFYEYLESIKEKPWYVKIIESAIAIFMTLIIASLWVLLMFFLVFGIEKIHQYSQECDNYYEIQEFDEPIPIVWTARFDGCLASCWGASFTREPTDDQHPRFSGYVPDNGERIADEFMQKGQILRVYGNWTDISHSYGSVFGRRCVPTVEIEKIEITDL